MAASQSLIFYVSMQINPIKIKNLKFTFRLIKKRDRIKLGNYFLSLSDKTKQWYSPHSFDMEMARKICNNDDPLYKRIIGLCNSKIISYCVLALEFRYWDKHRYKEEFIDEQVCAIAPSVTDKFQNMGVGTEMTQYVINVAKKYDKKVMILWGGVVCENITAINFYKKMNFKIVKTWYHPIKKVDSYDMYLDL
jgi:diamine N-acetyltransferase